MLNRTLGFNQSISALLMTVRTGGTFQTGIAAATAFCFVKQSFCHFSIGWESHWATSRAQWGLGHAGSTLPPGPPHPTALQKAVSSTHCHEGSVSTKHGPHLQCLQWQQWAHLPLTFCSGYACVKIRIQSNSVLKLHWRLGEGSWRDANELD